jgi:hypothetical protein
MKRIITLALVFCSTILYGQTISQVKTFGSAATEYVDDILTDSNGNIFVAGTFKGTADFDPGLPNTNTSSLGVNDFDVYLAKYDSTGSFLWVRTWESFVSTTYLNVETVISSSDEVVISFYSTSTLDLDPGVGSVTTFVGAGTTIFVKLDNNGNFIWGKRTASSGVPLGMTIDANDQLYIAGTFQNTADFDPGSGTNSLSSAGSTDDFLAKYDANGSLIWVKKIGGTGVEGLTALQMDQNNNILVGGRFNSNTIDLNPGGGVNSVNHSSNFDSFIVKLDSSGSHIWSGSISGNSADYIYAITTAANGDIYLGGSFSGQMDADINAGTQTVSSSGVDQDIFILKLNSAGAFQFVKSMGGISNDIVFDLALDASNTLFASGIFGSSVDFDPASGSAYLLSSNFTDGFVATYTSNGNFKMARKIGNGNVGTNVSNLWATNNVVYAAGNFDILLNIYTSTGYQSIPGLGSDVHFFKMNDCSSVLTASVTFSPDTLSGCSGSVVTVTANPVNGGLAPTYQWKLNGGVVSGTTGPVFSGTLNAGNTLTCSMTSSAGCVLDFITPPSAVVNNLSSPVTPSHFISTNPGIICNGVVVTFSSVATNGGSNPGYQWYQNNVLIPGATQSTFSPSVYAHNDNIACTLFPSSCTSLDSVSVNTFITVFQVPNASVNVNGNVLSAQTSGATYQWVDCNNNFAPIPNAIQQAFSPTSNGTYALIISNPFCSDTSTCQTITTIGLNDQDFLEQSIRILPNPANENTLVTLPDFIEVTSLTITDMAGRNFGYTSVLEKEKKVELSVGHLSAGIYILQLNHSTGVISKQLVVE